MSAKIATVVVGTSSYLDPMEVSLRRVLSATNTVEDCEHLLIVVTDAESAERVESMCSAFNNFKVIPCEVKEEGDHYAIDRQILIATLQSAGFSAAREWGCDFLWSVEADVLVPPNALKVSMQMLEFDDGYYDVSFVTYPSQGGGSFLGGHGEFDSHINEDFIDSERSIPKRLKTLKEACLKILNSNTKDRKKVKKESKRLSRINEKIKQCPPRANVFTLNGKKWRRRGWLENSHPGIGRGAVIQTDWTGLGCTLMSKKAASLAHFDGYEGKGTQDLFLNWEKWRPEGLNFCCITHIACDHVIRSGEDLATLKSYHEPSGETRGHLRYKKTKFNKFI